MKRFALAIALACVLSGSALAGDVHTGSDAPAPGEIHTPVVAQAPGDQHNVDATAPGDMGSGGVVGEMGNGATLLLTILDLLY